MNLTNLVGVILDVVAISMLGPTMKEDEKEERRALQQKATKLKQIQNNSIKMNQLGQFVVAVSLLNFLLGKLRVGQNMFL